MNFIFCLILSTLLFTSPSYGQIIKTVNNVDLSSYLGLWHEIIRLPNEFQDPRQDENRSPCFNTTAQYTEGLYSINVHNRCRYYDSAGELQQDEAYGKATIVNEKTNAKLRVNFIPIWKYLPFLRQLGSGDYWILGLGDKNELGQYTWAVVGEPKHRYGWILARDAQFSQSPQFGDALLILQQNGYNPNEFIHSQK